jgi:lipopolysaccharide biosynthesis protein
MLTFSERKGDSRKEQEHMTKTSPHALDLIAFYLPQYHTIPENDEWWGKGFTEWTNVRRAKPNFPGHLQPIEPGEFGYYDLRQPDIQVEQAKLARTYGLRGFCYYVYWFEGRRVLETPLDQMLVNPEVDIEFCVCWANENWTRRWDGQDDEILLGQPHTLESDQRFIHDMLKYIRDPRYIRINGRPVLLVYRPDILANPKATVVYWKNVVRDAGLGELNACAVEFYGVENPQDFGFDTLAEFPPHKSLLPENVLSPLPAFTNTSFSGVVFDYVKVRNWFLRKPMATDYTRYRGVMPRWDNTGRRQNTSHIFHGSDPNLFRDWVYWAGLETLLTKPPGERVVFINAWNEWGEGCMLEPEKVFGRGYLQAVGAAQISLDRKALFFDEFWAAFAKAEPHVSAQKVGAVKDIILSYERDVLAVVKMLRMEERPTPEEMVRSIPFNVLTRAYFSRLKEALLRRFVRMIGHAP